MEFILCAIATVTSCYLIFTLVDTIVGFRRVFNLKNQSHLDPNSLPSVSIILSACNEEDVIVKTLKSLLAIDYPNFDIIAIDDRSDDKTYELMLKCQKQNSQLRVYQIKELPPYWFGKNHALNFASAQSNQDWLLFTDADIIMKPDLLTKAMSYVVEKKIDHLTIAEYHTGKSYWLKVILFGQYLTYTMICKPWRIRHSSSNKALGHGAFNLVNKKTYQACGAHEAIAMECLDDVKLGELVKSRGYNQDVVDGRDYLEREWYATFRGILAGMKKNSAAFRDYRIIPIIGDSIIAFLVYLFPLIAITFFKGWVCWLNVVNVGLLFSISLEVTKQFRLAKYYALTYPISIFLLIYTIWNSLIAVIINRGVTWRGTLYPLAMIRKRNSLGK